MPFQNLSGDPEQEYFADGMVEEIITALSRIRWLFVIARNSSFKYKGKAIDVKQVGCELGVPKSKAQYAKPAAACAFSAQLIYATTAPSLGGPLRRRSRRHRLTVAVSNETHHPMDLLALNQIIAAALVQKHAA